MTPGEEHVLYETNRVAWIKQAAPKLANGFDEMTDKAINHMWDVAGDQLKHAVWELLTEPQRNRVRSVRTGSGS